jgi:DNA-binding transcriptional ArsR family regulator
VLDYLVTSRARRQLLRRLWMDRASGSVSALARASGLSFAAAHRELEAMKSAGLTVAERDGVATVYRANVDHPLADVLMSLLTVRAPADTTSAEQRLRGQLATLGAPLAGPAPRRDRVPAEEVLADALVLAHHSPTVARVLPVVFWRQRSKLDYSRLERAATRRDERQALGFFLELTGQLGGDRGLARRASELRDRRRTALRPFFTSGRGPVARAAAQRRSPAVARRWGYLMTMELESFASAFRKHVPTAA